MKKIILVLALLLMVMGAADARMSGVMMSGSGTTTEGASCGILFEQSTRDSYAVIGADAGRLYMMSTFTPTAGSIKTVYIRGYKSGTGNTLTAYLCDAKDSPPVPDDDPACVAADATFDTSSIGQDYSYNIKFNWAAGYTVDAAQHILMVVGDGVDESNFTRWGIYFDVPGDFIRRSADGSTWASEDTSAQSCMKVTSCEE